MAAPSGELTTNGDFETGDTTGWQSFPSSGSTFAVTGDANSGSFGAELTNTALASAAVIKQANLGIGSVQPGDMVTISFAAKGSFAVGGVGFVELFSEGGLDGGTTNQFLGGGPLFQLNDEWQTLCFTVMAGPDVDAGITLQVAAITGGAAGSTASFSIDDVSVTINELGVNGDFELGDTSGWQAFLTPNATFDVTGDAANGSFAGALMNPDEGAAAVVKQANLGIDFVEIGDTIRVSFNAKGDLGVGGVIFAEFFTEGASGVSSQTFLGGGPIFPGATYEAYSFTTTIGADVTNGITLQMAAVTGAIAGSFANVTLDDVSIELISGNTGNYCTASLNSTGAAGIMSSAGSTSVGADDFVLSASGLPASTFCLFVVGTDTAFTPGFDGTMCIGTPCRIGPIQMSDGAGIATRTMPSADYATYGCTAPLAGDRLNFQCLYRDSAGTGGNWTDALCVTFGE